MKKFIALTLVSLLVLTGCQGKVNKPGQLEPKTYSIGTAVVNSVVDTQIADGEKGKFESNVLYVTVALEGDKFAYVIIDEAQNAIQFTNDAVDPFEAVGTKKERGMDYGMNWHEQVKELETYLVGKTLDEVKAGDPASDLNSTVSIYINGFLTTVEEAVNNAVVVDNVVGIASSSTVSGSEKEGELEIGTTVSAVAVDGDGKVVYAFIDESQLQGVITDGVLETTGTLQTKGQQKEDYGMSKAGSTEWYLQVEHLTDWAIGKSSSEIAKAGEDADVTSTVSVYSGNFVKTLTDALAKTKY